MARARHALVVLSVLASGLVAGCPEPPPGITVAEEIGPRGGSIVLDRAVLTIPAGAVDRTVRFSVTRLPTPPPSDDAITALWRFEPSDLDLAVPARVTLPAESFATIRIARWSLPGSTTDFEDAPVRDGSRLAVTTERSRLGRVFAEARSTTPFDGGVPDAPRLDAPLPDVPIVDVGPDPIAPVTVGVDLRPANFTCRGTRTAGPTTGAPQPLPLRVVELFDGGARASSFSARDALGPLGTGVTDSTGVGTLDAREGAWTTLTVEFPSGATDALILPLQTVTPVVLGASATTTVEVLSSRSVFNIGMALSPFFDTSGELALILTDCDGQPVQRARIRLFDDATGAELLDRTPVGYTSGTSRVPSLAFTRTSIDGRAFATSATDPTTGAGLEVRVEVWGALTLGAPEERLGCEVFLTATSSPVVGTVGPTRADGPASCL